MNRRGSTLRTAAWWVLVPVLVGVGLARPAVGQTEKATVEVRTRHGERVVLREIGFGSRVVSRGAPPGGAMPPGVEPGEMPGGIGDRLPRVGPGAGGMEPPGAEIGGRPTFEEGLGRYRGRVRRIVVLLVDNTGVVADVTLVNGKTLDHHRMPWSQVYGWDRPGEQGKFYSFDAEEIDTLEFLTH